MTQKDYTRSLPALGSALFGGMLLAALAFTPRVHAAGDLSQSTGQYAPMTSSSALRFTPCSKTSLGSNMIVHLRSDLNHSVPAGQLGIYASIENRNSFPGVDGLLQVDVTKDASSTEPSRVVASFVAARSIDVPASGSTTVPFVWQVPADAENAHYIVEAHYLFAVRPFLPPVTAAVVQTAGVLDIPIESKVKGAVYIDPASIQFDKEPHTATYIFKPGEPTPVTVQVFNTGMIPYHGAITWRLYENARSPLGNPVDQIVSDVRVHPHTSSTVSYTLPAIQGASYYLEGHLEGNNASQSVVGVQLTKAGVCAPSLLENPATFVMVIIIAAIIALILVGFFSGYFMKKSLFSRRRE